MFDVTAIGELLIDMAQSGLSDIRSKPRRRALQCAGDAK